MDRPEWIVHCMYRLTEMGLPPIGTAKRLADEQQSMHGPSADQWEPPEVAAMKLGEDGG